MRTTYSRKLAEVRSSNSIAEESKLSEVELEIIGFCVRAAATIGASRSMGEIFGLIFCSEKPVTFDYVVRALGISNGSASQGLRRLSQLGLISPCYVQRDRRVHYELKASLRTLVSALFEEHLLAPLGMAGEQIDQLRTKLNEQVGSSPILQSRIELLANWNAKFRAALKPMIEALG